MVSTQVEANLCTDNNTLHTLHETGQGSAPEDPPLSEDVWTVQSKKEIWIESRVVRSRRAVPAVLPQNQKKISKTASSIFFFLRPVGYLPEIYLEVEPMTGSVDV